TTAALLRLLFHDCFIEGCDASVMLDDSNGNSNKSIERQAIPNKTLKGFDKIARIKDELEKACPGVVSCADTLVLATRDSVHMAGGPFYPVFTGRRDSTSSHFNAAIAGIPKPDDNITQTLHLFSLRGFDAKETHCIVSHGYFFSSFNVGKIGCEFIGPRLNNFQGTGRPDSTLTPNFLDEMRRSCEDNNSSDSAESPTATNSRKLEESASRVGMSYYQGLSAAVGSGSGFDSHYYRSLINNRGLLFADQQLMADDRTRNVVGEYASDDGATFRRDFARAMFKMSNLNVLTGEDGVVLLNCSMPVS
uniref:Peroxidase n=1 Tax=Kalanchoe fedtschenkoi TaxID=63787 RepID=A0A7N0T153_KALFE